jgi:peptidoglycan hydrolase-like protein with peptidoglycan-binding domain
MTLNKKMLYGGAVAIALGLATVFYIVPQSALASAVSTLSGRDLTVGSSGSDVADLQGLLGEQGFLTMPVGVPFGYFGPITKASLASYQASIGVPATGYYGPLTRMKMVEIFTTNGWMALLTNAGR